MVSVTMIKKISFVEQTNLPWAAILDVLKLQLYKFHYERNVTMYGEKHELSIKIPILYFMK